VVMSPQRFEIYLVSLDPTRGAEIKKTRPCLIVSPNEMNQFLSTVIVAPMTTKLRGYPCRVSTRLQGKTSEVALDHLKRVDKTRLIKRLSQLDASVSGRVSDTLVEMFSF